MAGPKTIDQIHKEVEREAKQAQLQVSHTTPILVFPVNQSTYLS